MLTKMDVFSGSLLNPTAFEFDEDGQASLDQIQIHTIDGLDPVKATVNTTQYGSIDGAYFTGASVGLRNIVLTIGYRPDWVNYTIEDLRMVLYQYFMPKQKVTFRFESTHLPTVTIDGIVESITPNLFSQDPECQVSIICPEPDFVAIENVVMSGTAVDILAAEYTAIAYAGSVETSVQVQVKPSAAKPTYSGLVYVMNQGIDLQTFTVTAEVDASAYFNFDSTDGARDVSQINTSGVKTSIMKQIGVGVNWVKMLPGLNNFTVATTGGGQDWQLTYTPRFGGL